MGQGYFMRLSPRKPGSTLERVHWPENIIQQGQIVWRFFQFEQVWLNSFEMFLGFGYEIRK